MATIRPFSALRPDPALASQICEPPYDVMSTEEARKMAAGNPLSFLRVSRPEIEFPPGSDPYALAVYERGRENLQRLIGQGALRMDDQACFYLYRQVMGPHQQTGIVAAASCKEYLDGIIRKHELTRIDKENDRVRHIQILGSQTGPAFLTYRDIAGIDDWTRQATTAAPEVDFTAPDGVRHSSWRIDRAEDQRFLMDAFARTPCLYIADGHHRSAAAARVFRSLDGRGNSGGFLAVLFSHRQVQILAYNRAVRDLNGLSPEELLQRLGKVFIRAEGPGPTPRRKHDIRLRLEGAWHSLRFRPELSQPDDVAADLDVSLLQRHVLGPIFGIDDPRTSNRIQFVGGIRGTEELERLVASGEAACAFSLVPTTIEELMSVSDAGGIMPPKSTWFEPKLRDAMFCLPLAAGDGGLSTAA
jgi:uncharacterized protein (DUF1015 family)